jgi:hypothetical protein
MIISGKSVEIGIDALVDEVVDHIMENDANLIFIDRGGDPQIEDMELKSVIREVFSRWAED